MTLDALVFRLGWTLVHFLWQGTLVALALAAGLRMLRRSSASLRYSLACAALLALTVQPIATFFLLDAPQPAPPPSFASPRGGTTTPTPEALHSLRPRTGWSLPFAGQSERMLPMVVVIWAAGVIVMLALHLAGWANVHRWKRQNAAPLDPAWQARMDRLRTLMQVRRGVAGLQSALLDTPVVIGWLKPAILVPVSVVAGMDPQQLETLLLHELAHIRRHDYLVNLLQAQVETLGFYHPAVWWVSSVIRRERESCCDDLVVAALPDRRVYLRALVQLEELRSLRPALGLAASGGSLLDRVQRLAGGPAADQRRAGAVAALAIGLALLGSLPALWSLPQAGGKWEALFDGRSLAGWQQLSGTGRFYVEGGAIVGTSVPSPSASFLCTRREYSDFALEFDVRVDPQLNAGVQFRSRPGRPGEDGKVVGYQVEIDGEQAGTSGGIWDEARRNLWLPGSWAGMHRAGAFRESGVWNHYRLLCRGNSIQTWINGVACARLTDSVSDRGFIGLQVFNRAGHGPLAVRWRNIRVERL